MNSQCSVSMILNRLSHYVSAICDFQVFKGGSLSKIEYVN